MGSADCKIVKRMLGYVSIVCSFLVAVLILPCRAGAIERVDASQVGSLSVTASYDGTAVPGMTFRIYQVASYSDDGSLKLAGDVVDCGIDVTSLTAKSTPASAWDKAAGELLTWVREHAVKAAAAQATAANGRAVFRSLKPGLYLLEGDSVTLNGHRYTPSAYLESVPTRAADEGDGWVYDVASAVKISRIDASSDASTSDTKKPSSSDGSHKKASSRDLFHRLGLVSTGDNQLTTAGVLVCIGIGAIIAATGLCYLRR